uniref:Methyltransferase n=1 Tax=Ananas comosus var. bracteatus TaxID=296719 RepID=A0A6V7NID6_ANACO|nr:unnamed protein product [Ananas comosus var. bracteatus]
MKWFGDIQKPMDNKCYEQRTEENPPFCRESDDPDAAWNISLQACMHKLSQLGVYGNLPLKTLRQTTSIGSGCKQIVLERYGDQLVQSQECHGYEISIWGFCCSLARHESVGDEHFISTYPRTYDLLHADHLFSKIKKRCKLVPVFAEVDRILRPEGKLIVRDNVETISELENMARSLQWEVRMTFSKDKEGLLCVQKMKWRPKEVEASM